MSDTEEVMEEEEGALYVLIFILLYIHIVKEIMFVNIISMFTNYYIFFNILLFIFSILLFFWREEEGKRVASI